MLATRSTLTALETAHLPEAVALSRQAGWPHRLEDWSLALGLSQGVAAMDADGRLVGTAFMTPFGTEVGTINMVIVDEAQRGQGIGRRLMQAVLDLGESRELRLIATADGLPLYEKLGFRALGQIVQHQGPACAGPKPEGVTSVSEPDLALYTRMDAEAFGAARTDLFRALAQVGRFAECRGPDGVAGFAVLRPFGRGEVIGPVVARSVADATALIAYWISERPGAFLRVDIMADSGLSPWLSSLGLAQAGGGTAMRRGSSNQSAASPFTTFALANQALS